MKRHKILVLCGLLFAAQVALGEVKLDVHPDRESGVYAPGDQVIWTVKAAAGSDPVSGALTWAVKRGGLDAAEKGDGAFRDGAATFTGKRADPGTLLLEVKYRPEGADRDVVVRGGAVFAPDQIKSSSPVPEDFDAFWAKKIEQLHAIPMNVKLEAIDVGDPTIEYFKITMDNINGRKIYGQIARPKGGTALPALLQVQWAGVYPLHRDWVTGYAKKGWLSMNIIAHDLPIDEPADFYKQKSAKELDDYPGIGADDRETTYFLPMFLSCRARSII